MSRFILLLCCYLIFGAIISVNPFHLAASIFVERDTNSSSMPLDANSYSDLVVNTAINNGLSPSAADYPWQIFVMLFLFCVVAVWNMILTWKLYESKKKTTIVRQERDLLANCVTERSHELAELRTLFKNAAQAAKFGIFDYDLVTGKLKWDESMFDIYEVSPDKFSSAYTEWSNAVLPEDLPNAETALQRAIQGEAPFNTHFRIRRGNNGEVVIIRALGQVYRDNEGTPIRVVGVNQINQDVVEKVPRQAGRHFTAHSLPPTKIVATTANSPLAGRKILVVEDNAINQKLLITLLDKQGVIVEVAKNGRQCLHRITSSVFDAVLMDIEMPEMDGISATRLIRADKKFAQLPIIAMTAHTLDQDYEKSLAAGMNAHLVKPVDFAKLIDTLTHWIVKNAVQPPVSSPVTPTPALTDDLPASLPPFDITAALSRTNGNPKLLRKLLLMFHDNYVSATATLQQLITEQDYAQAERLAHSLKGVAGTLEARELYNAALAVEKAFRAGDTAAVTALIDELDKELMPALTAAATLINTAPTDIPVIATVSISSNRASDTIAPLLAELHDHIVHNKLKARKLFAHIAEQLVNCGVDAELTDLQTKLEQLDFTGALPVLEQLTTKLNLSK